MPISLTSQEKKVLGFIAVMTALGLVMLGVRHWNSPEPRGGKPAAPAVETKIP